MNNEQTIKRLAEQIAETAANGPAEPLVSLVQKFLTTHLPDVVLSALVVACNGLGLVIQTLQPDHSIHMEVHRKGDIPPGMTRAHGKRTH